MIEPRRHSCPEYHTKQCLASCMSISITSTGTQNSVHLYNWTISRISWLIRSAKPVIMTEKITKYRYIYVTDDFLLGLSVLKPSRFLYRSRDVDSGSEWTCLVKGGQQTTSGQRAIDLHSDTRMTRLYVALDENHEFTSEFTIAVNYNVRREFWRSVWLFWHYFSRLLHFCVEIHKFLTWKQLNVTHRTH